MSDATNNLATTATTATTVPGDLLDAETAVMRLRAAGEPTRLRILSLLAGFELSVKELTQVLGQSQPRISRHLKLLAEAGLIARFREGAWVNIRLAEPTTAAGRLAEMIVSTLDPHDEPFERDHNRAVSILDERARSAERYFASHASEWDEIRSLHVDETRVETAMRALLGVGPFSQFLDVGTGTGRILELFADRYERGLGIDSNPSMLAYARSRLERETLSHAQVRQGDLYNIAARDNAYDAIVVHQVLHFLSEPGDAIGELGRVLAADGQLLIVDFAPHDLAFLREKHAHQMLGIDRDQINGWLTRAGLQVVAAQSLSAKGAEEGALSVNLWLAAAPASRHVTTEKQTLVDA